jgi:hypothetical protein
VEKGTSGIGTQETKTLHYTKINSTSPSHVTGGQGSYNFRKITIYNQFSSALN